jgi:serine O-acetyltransferase
MGVEVLESEQYRTEEPALVAALDDAIDAKDAKEINRLVAALQPPLLFAIFEDARSFCLHRDEPVDFSSKWRKWRTVLRLMWAADDYFGLVLYRLRCALKAKGVPVLPRLLDILDIVLYQIRIGDHVVLKEGAYIPHGQIGLYGITYIGRRCVWGPWSGAGTVPGTSSWGPRVGNDVMVGTGARILGRLYVGANATVSANSIVYRDVPPHATAMGVPARVISARPGSPSTNGEPASE